MFKHVFSKNISVLVGGTAFAQLVSISVLPLLTRLYSPEDFGVLAVYTSIYSLIAVIACLRFEISIPIPEDRVRAKSLLAVSLVAVCFTTFFVSVAGMIFSSEIHDITQGKLIGYLWLIPVGGFLAGVYNAFQYWATREKDFFLISRTRVSQAVTCSSAQVGFGFLGFTPLGLLIGQVLNVATGIVSLLWSYLEKSNNVDKKIKINDLKEGAIEYRRFPQYSALEALANSAAVQVPVLLIASYAAGAEVGFIMLAMRLMSAPVSLIGKSVAQVYLSEAGSHFQKGDLSNFTIKNIFSLVKIGIFPFMVLGFFSPLLVPLIFGNDWDRVGMLISWMVPWFFMQFISSPVSMSLHIAGHQKIALLLQMLGLLFRAGAVVLSGVFLVDYIAEIYALTGFIFYSVYTVVILYMLKNSEGSDCKMLGE